MLKFRLATNRSRKSKMEPEFRTIVDLEDDIRLSNTVEVLGTKENNGNIIVEIKPYFENEKERAERLRKYVKRSIKMPKK